MKIALGDAASGVFTNSEELFKSLEEAGSITGDRVWQFPSWKLYTDEITKQPSFDVNNIGKGRGGGSCTAAAFLKEFVPKDTKWMHLDIAGVAMSSSAQTPYLSKGMTGRPTRTLIEFIHMQSRRS